MLRPVCLDDAPSLCAIYNHYVAQTHISFEEVAVAEDEMRQRIAKTTETYPWLVCEEDGVVLGYAYGSKWRERPAYRFTVEATVYLDANSTGKGRGSALLDALLTDLRLRGFHTALAVIALPNDPSVALFRKFGFQQAARFTDAGYKFEKWIDVSNWQLILLTGFLSPRLPKKEKNRFCKEILCNQHDSA